MVLMGNLEELYGYFKGNINIDVNKAGAAAIKLTHALISKGELILKRSQP